MDSFNYQINESNDANGIDLTFVNRSDFSSSDFERVLESQDSLLNTIEPMNGCPDTSLFFNPINEILGEINEYEKGFFIDQTSDTVTSREHIREPIYDSASTSNEFYTLMGMHNFGTKTMHHPRTTSGDIDVCNSNETTEQSTLLYKELDSPDYTSLEGDYTPTMNQWFINLEQQHQAAYMNDPPLLNFNQLQTTSTAPIDEEGIFNQNSKNLLNTAVTFPSSTAVAPIAMDANYCSNPPIRLVNNQTALDATLSLVNNVTNTTEFMYPISANNSIHKQPEQESRIVSQPIIQTNNRFSTNYNQNIKATDNSPLTLTTVRSLANMNCLNNLKSLEAESANKRKSLNAQQKLYTDGSRHVALMGLGQTSSLNWAAVFPRKNLIQSPEMIIMHPLRTRKLITSRRINTPIGTSEPGTKPICTAMAPSCVSSAGIVYPFTVVRATCNNPSNSSCIDFTKTGHAQKSPKNEDVQCVQGNLSEYFDTSFNIPMIKERSRSENRRKQKHHIIPGAETLIFEVQTSEQIETTNGELNNTRNTNDVEDPYPESELPELDDIFRRKKKTNITTAAGSKRTYISQPISVGNDSTQKKHCPISIIQTQQSVAVEEPFKDNISLSISIQTGTSNLCTDKNNLAFSSESDSAESISDNDDIGRSKKCHKCKKLFKTTRSLAIHAKRCVNLEQQNSVFTEDGNNNYPKSANDFSGETINKTNTNKKMSEQYSEKIIRPSSLKSNEVSELNGTYTETEENSETSIRYMLANDKKHPRPITRSQTRRSTGRSIPYSFCAKNSK